MTNRTTYQRWGLVVSLGLLVICGSLGTARAEQKRLGVPIFKGPGEGASRNAVMKAGKANHYQIVGAEQITKTAKGMKMTLDTNDAFKAVARELGIAAFVVGEVTTKRATLTIRNGADGSVTGEASFTGPNPKKLGAAVGQTFWRRLGAAIDRGKAPSGAKKAAVAEEEMAPEPADSAADTEPPPPAESRESREDSAEKRKKVLAALDEATAAEEADRPRKSKKKKVSEDSEAETTVSAKADLDEDEGGPRPEALVVAVGPRALARTLSYTQDRYGRNRKYTLPLAPELALSADFFPAAMSSSGFIANLGLALQVNYLIPGAVTSPPSPGDTSNYGTFALDYSIGAKVRLPVGAYATVAYGSQRYQLTGQSNTALLYRVPTVDYKIVRAGAGARVAVSPVISVMVNAAYIRCLSLGPIGTAPYYPKGTGAGFEAGAALGYRIGSMFEIEAGADIRRYGLAFHQNFANAADMALINDPNGKIAGGAIDQYLSGWVALAVVMGGEGGGRASRGGDDEEAEAAPAKSDSDEDAEEKPAKKKKKKKAAAEEE